MTLTDTYAPTAPDAASEGDALTFMALCDALVARNIQLHRREAREHGRLAYTAPAGAMTPAIRAALAAHRGELLAALLAPVGANVLPARPLCGWGKAHYHAWQYHAGWRNFICRICHPRAWDVPPMPPTPPAEAWPDWTPTPPAEDTGASSTSASHSASSTDGEPEPGPRSAPPAPPTPTPTRAPRPASGGHAPRVARLAVIDASGVYVESADGRGRVERASLAPDALPTPGACHAGALVELARTLGVAQVWIHATWGELAGLPTRADMARLPRETRRAGVAHPFITDALAGGWDMQPATLASWLIGLRRGAWGRFSLVMPWLDTRAPWGDAPDGETLLAALLAYRAAMGGHAFYRSPGATSSGLIKALHASEHALDLSASMTPVNFPPPARIPATVGDMAWIRPLDARELALADRGADRGAAWVHGYDKHGMYLGAASALWLGMGEARQYTRERDGEALAGLVATLADKTTRKNRRPGYWLASIDYAPPVGMPNPFAATLAPRADRVTWSADAPRWVATPTLELALELGARVDVREAWVWSERHRPLETWRTTLASARETLARAASSTDATSAPALALAAVKTIYRQGIGWLDGSWLRASERGEALYRPDWRHAIIATAGANFYRNGLAVYQAHGLAPVAAYTDAWYYVSPLADARAACPSTDKVMRLDAASLAGWSVKASAPLVGRVRGAFDALAALATPRGVPAWQCWRGAMLAIHGRETEEDDTDAASSTGAGTDTESEG